MAGVAKQIIGSFEDLGKQVGSEVIKAPGEIAGKALESLGTSGKSQKGQQSTSLPQMPAEAGGKPTPLDELGKAKDAKTKQAIAHAALEYLAAKPKHEPSVWEKTQKEEKEKKEQAQKQAAAAAMNAPISTPSKPRRGNLYGIKEKASLERKTQVRQD